jgi:hypothetical protein
VEGGGNIGALLDVPHGVRYFKKCIGLQMSLKLKFVVENLSPSDEFA